MTPIVEKLFLYASEMNFHPYLSIKEYHHYTQEEEKTEAKIRQLLSLLRNVLPSLWQLLQNQVDAVIPV
ncbi:MAG: hypothetical protein HFF74_09050 [Oscillospiraceae bacterium]|nr:hypothetical protein [Oscillospiraceae bacterium]